jgi:eukaryotic-like serine/threonine-protein kinase
MAVVRSRDVNLPARTAAMPRPRFLSRPADGWLVGLVLLLGAGAQFGCPLWQSVDQAWNDRVAALSAAPVDDTVVFVAIDDASVNRLGPWPWPRTRTAEPLSGADGGRALAELQQIATLVATDPDLTGHPTLPAQLSLSHDELDGDTQLAQSLAALRFSALAAPSGEAPPDTPLAADLSLPDVLRKAAQAIGHVRFEPDGDGVIRSQPRQALTTEGDRVALAWQLAVAHGTRLKLDAGDVIRPMPAPRHGALTPSVSAWQLLDGASFARLKASLRGKVAIIGRSDADAPRLQINGRPRADASRAEAVAWVTAALVDGRVQLRPTQPSAVPAIALAIVGGALLGVWPRLQTRTLLLSTAALVAILLLAAQLSIGLLHMPIDTAGAALTLVLGTLVLVLLRRHRGHPSDGATAFDATPPGSWPPAVDATEVTAAPLPATPLAEVPRPAHPGLPRLGRYQLERELGRGTMGRVYLAHEIGQQTEVAVKTLALAREFEGFALREARARFQTEAQAARRLRHPDIVQVFEAGEERGLAYIVMERLHGSELTPYVHARALLPVSTVVAIGARVADALAHAHSQGVIHRDIKPANVMIDGPRDQVKVMDFGIARLHDASRTRTGLVLGSPSYMSPEQLAGREVDGRSDLYSLGVLLFQMLTAQLPLVGASMAGLIHAIANVKAPDVRELRASVPEALADVISILLEKRAELRYRNGHELATDLRLIGKLLQRRSAPQAGRPELSARTPVTGGEPSVHEVAPEAAAASTDAAAMRAQSPPDHGP